MNQVKTPIQYNDLESCNIDYVLSNVKSSQFGAVHHIFEDNVEVIGRSPTMRRLRPTLANPILADPILASPFGQPILANPFLANPSLLLLLLLLVGTPPPDPPPDRPTFRSFFSLSRLHFVLFVSLWESSRGIWVVFVKTGTLNCARLGSWAVV